MEKLFGTDGIRGKANTYPITPEVALQLGKAIAHVFGAGGHGSAKAVLGKDTRLSGYMIETALTSGLVSMGMDVLSVGPMPTPAIAHLTKSMCAACGIMITASHNPSDDNGIKVFDSNGFKLPDSMEEDIERHILGGEINSAHISTSLLGKAYRMDDAVGRYIAFAKASIDNRSLKGVKIVLDCANGAAYKIAPLIFKELGVEVVETGVVPDGFNINENCGATHTEELSEFVRGCGADIGVALDGDADRVIFCDESGSVVNGDRIIGICAMDYKERGRLMNDTVVVTSMSNLGLVEALERSGIKTEFTDVGDRYVIDRMREKGFNIGGEQSGHIIFMDHVTTGDGIITALHLISHMLEKNSPLSELAGFMTEFPQKLTNIQVSAKPPISELPELEQLVSECESRLASSGRVIVRYSGTENKMRILLEARDAALVDEWSAKFAETVSSLIGV
ncbi:MAG: phosphoglucosamine mutase [Kiritimatiellaeota bacterium]|nr:phosphoglucosamine mutase [Kiritimatiellota bacterium]